jgi:hypothetical protein
MLALFVDRSVLEVHSFKVEETVGQSPEPSRLPAISKNNAGTRTEVKVKKKKLK